MFWEVSKRTEKEHASLAATQVQVKYMGVIKLCWDLLYGIAQERKQDASENLRLDWYTAESLSQSQLHADLVLSIYLIIACLLCRIIKDIH